MKVDSLDELRSAFAEWRRRKRHAREAMPEELLARARRATEKHGVTAVVAATRVERARLFRSRPAVRTGCQGNMISSGLAGGWLPSGPILRQHS